MIYLDNPRAIYAFGGPVKVKWARADLVTITHVDYLPIVHFNIKHLRPLIVALMELDDAIKQAQNETGIGNGKQVVTKPHVEDAQGTIDPPQADG